MHTLSQCKFLVLTLYYSYARCNHWGKLGEWYMEPLCTIFATSCESVFIFQNAKS